MRNKASYMSAVALLAVIVGALIGGLNQTRQEITEPEQRLTKAVVDEVSAEFCTVTFVDEGGDLWVAEVDDTLGFKSGDKYILTFDDMGTPNPYDDELVDIF